MWGSLEQASLLPFLLDTENPLTTTKLIETLIFQVALLGSGCIFLYLKVIPAIVKRQGTHTLLLPEDFADRQIIFPEETWNLEETYQVHHFFPLNLIFSKAKRWYDHMWWSLASTLMRGSAAIVLTIVLAILLTDTGWLKAWNTYTTVTYYGTQQIVNGWQMVLLMARSAGAPNGAHLLDYIALPVLGLYVAYKYRNKDYSVPYDFIQGCLIVAFGVGLHEGIWLIAYFEEYYQFANLAILPNIAEDIGFSIMIMMFLYAFWKYPFRTIPIKTFRYPAYIYTAYVGVWLWYGLPITTINNFQIGHGIYEQTKWWADPTVNAIEIGGWLLLTVLMFVFIRREKIETKVNAI